MASQQQIYQTLINVGASPQEAQTLSAIAMAESGGNEKALNDSNIETSAGWFQINTDVHPLSIQQAQDPATGAQYALSLFRQQGPRPWSVTHGNNPPYLKYMGGNMAGDNVPSGGVADRVASGQGAPSNVKPVYGEGGTVIGYEVTYSDGSFDVLSPAEYGNLQQYGDPAGPNAGEKPTAVHNQIVGTQPPDPYAAAQTLFDQFEAGIAAGKFNAEQAAAAYDRAFDQIIANYNVAVQNQGAEATNVGNKLQADIATGNLGVDYAQLGQNRAQNIMQGQQALTNEATNRARIVSQDILPRSLPQGVGLNLPGAGQVPLQNVNIEQLLNQGLPSLQSQYGGLQDLFPAIGPAPTITAGTVNPISPLNFAGMPQVPQIPAPPVPDVSGLMGQIQGGFPGWQFAPSFI